MHDTSRTGRWVILLDDGSAPVFWSVERDALDGICRHVRQTCPTARVAWQDVEEPRWPKTRREASDARAAEG